MQTIIYGAGAQLVEAYATDALGRRVKPTSATATIVDLEFLESDPDADRIILAVGATTVDTLSTTTSAATGARTADPRKIPMTSGTGFTVGRHYIISAAGVTESFEVDRVNSNDVYARDELRGTYATAAVVTGCRVTATFPSDRANLAAELDRRTIYATDWVFTGPTGPTHVRTLCRIERRGRAPRASVADLTLIDSRFAAASHDSTRLENHLQQADREINARLMHANRQISNTDDGEVGKQAVAWRAATLAYIGLGDDFETRAAEAAKQAKEWLGMLLSGHKADDQVETSRPNDRVYRKRRAGLPGPIVGPST
jgi:hypothetical protein